MAVKPRARGKKKPDAKKAGLNLECGVVMPISPLDGCTAEHWLQVRTFLIEAIAEIEAPRFSAKLVSEEPDVGMILKRIVQNVYNTDIVLCDVSGKNPNVMFELGMRMAFNKPVVIIKDDATDYTFDTSVIEHLEYPRDLRYPRMIAFREHLQEKIVATYLATQKAGYEGFLKSFGNFEIAKLEQKNVSFGEGVLEMLSDMRKEIAQVQAAVSALRPSIARTPAEIAATLGIGQLANQMRIGEAAVKAGPLSLVGQGIIGEQLRMKLSDQKK